MNELQKFREVARKAVQGYVVFRYPANDGTERLVYHQLDLPIEILELMRK